MVPGPPAPGGGAVRYEHEQRAYAIHWVVAPILAIVAVGMLSSDGSLWVWLLVAGAGFLFAWSAATFGTLTVIVEDDHLRLYFGRGWPRKAIPLRDVASAVPVRNRWWYGLGIRWIPGGWLWNVWGLDAVELRLSTGRVFRVGTDDVDGLVAAIAR